MRAKRRNYGLHMKLPYQVSRQGQWYIAQCTLLKSAGQGRTERAAVKNLTDAIALKIQRGLETGRLSKMLHGYGFHGVRVGDRLCWAHPDESNVGERILDRSVFLKTPEPEQPAPKGRGLPSDDLRWIIAWQASEPSSGYPRAY